MPWCFKCGSKYKGYCYQCYEKSKIKKNCFNCEISCQDKYCSNICEQYYTKKKQLILQSH